MKKNCPIYQQIYDNSVYVVVGIRQSERPWISALNLEHPLVWLKRPILEEQLLLQ